MNDIHNEAQELAFAAESLLASGDTTSARSLFLAAARKEESALESLPERDEESIGAIGLSAAALYYNAHDFKAAVRVSHEILRMVEIEYYTKQLYDILDESRDQIELARRGLEYAPGESDISLEGGQVGYGTAPIEVALAKMSAFSALARRIHEWKLGLPFRAAGEPLSPLVKAVTARVSQPAAGSYRFRLQFTRPSQLSFLDPIGQVHDESAEPIDVSKELFGVLADATNNNMDTFAAMPTGYARGILRLVRNVLPDGEEVDAVTVRDATSDGLTPVRLEKSSRKAVNNMLRSFEPKVENPNVSTKGILRAVHLEDHYIGVLEKNKDLLVIRTRPDEPDDVLSALVNKLVVARWEHYRNTKRLIDIDLAVNERADV